MEVVGELSKAPRLEEETVDTQNMEDNLVLSTQGKEPRGLTKPGEGEALEDKKILEEYPFRWELEELLSSPMGGLKEGDLLEEGEIVVHHPLPRSPL